MKNVDDGDLRIIHLEEVRSRIDKAMTSLNRGQGIDGEKFMQRILSDLDSRKAKPESASRKGT